MEIFDDDRSIPLKEGLDLADLQDPTKGAVFELDQEEIPKGDECETKNNYFNKHDVYDNILKYDEEVFAAMDDGREPFEVMQNSMEDISGDGGVFKKVLRPGAGPVVPRNSLVRVHYNAYKEGEEEPFDSSRLRTEVDKFHLFRDSRVLGFHVAVSTMKKGEISRFLFKPTYFYGAMGCGQRIPPNCTALFDIELLSFVENNGVEDYYSKTEEERRLMPFEEIAKVAKAERLEGNERYNQNTFGKALSSYKKALRILEDCHLKNEEEEKECIRQQIRVNLNIAQCLLNLNDYPRVIMHCNKVLHHETHDDPEKFFSKANFRKAKAFQQQGRFDEAEKFYFRARRTNPSCKEIGEALKKLEQQKRKYQLDEKEICLRMFRGLRSTDAEEETQSEIKQNEENITEEFVNSVKNAVRRFVNNGDETEMLFPNVQLTPGEVECILEIAVDEGLAVQRRGTGNSVRIALMKKTKR
ncbi:inactive peptidyl-prolyl cis-trans isomerase FKBP6-like isoform X1 [Pomacea canaliculata]|uniref:inactive peptidyl-prolyl cis-trans isomerase FKBP6-like isoform X1 n=1 Tax=Pomacea canaliculata TaxID=400727 RepID=UPI000D725F9A|nr:inactive peptidyl-prolyl cis-trans isomerase FKBP6-like isoform X1 [Pomacea canaliculata]